jgi:TetR/AcrR family transcriptional regulator
MVKQARRSSTAEREDEGETTRGILLAAARSAFAESGLEGARVDDIAHRAGVNKQLVYHYFGSKDELYTAVLEQVYSEIRSRESELNIGALSPVDAIRKLIEFEFDHHLLSPDFVRILSDENAHGGRHLRGTRAGKLNRPIVHLIETTLRRGVASGDFRSGLDALQVYLSIAALPYFYFGNIHTLSRAFDSSLATKAGQVKRRQQIVDFALHALLQNDTGRSSLPARR